RRRHTSSRRDWSSDVCSSDRGAEKNTSPHKDQGNSTNKDLSERSSRPLPKISRSIGVERAGKMREAYAILDKIEHKLGSGKDFRSEERRVGNDGGGRAVQRES